MVMSMITTMMMAMIIPLDQWISLRKLQVEMAQRAQIILSQLKIQIITNLGNNIYILVDRHLCYLHR